MGLAITRALIAEDAVVAGWHNRTKAVFQISEVGARSRMI